MKNNNSKTGRNSHLPSTADIYVWCLYKKGNFQMAEKAKEALQKSN